MYVREHLCQGGVLRAYWLSTASTMRFFNAGDYDTLQTSEMYTQLCETLCSPSSEIVQNTFYQNKLCVIQLVIAEEEVVVSAKIGVEIEGSVGIKSVVRIRFGANVSAKLWDQVA